jgi:UDP-N-acetylmuramate-alanine ligase
MNRAADRTRFDRTIGPIHFIGIGGIGMSGIAEVMANLGYQVQGSDVSEGYVVQGLRDKGITVHIGHGADNLGDAAVVVVSTAIKRATLRSRRPTSAASPSSAAPRCSRS